VECIFHAFTNSEIARLGFAPFLTHAVKRSMSTDFLPLGPFSYQPSMSIASPSLRDLFSCTTMRNFLSPFFPVRNDRITNAIVFLQRVKGYEPLGSLLIVVFYHYFALFSTPTCFIGSSAIGLSLSKAFCAASSSATCLDFPTPSPASVSLTYAPTVKTLACGGPSS
jgi:hypothetical protein